MHSSMRRRAAARLGVLLVALGTRLEKYEHADEVMAYELGR